MITRSDYMENASELHHAFFSQFVTESTKKFVLDRIGLNKLQASNDPHLNDVVEWERGGRTWLWDRSPVNEVLLKEAGESYTQSTRTCVGKAAAKILLAEFNS